MITITHELLATYTRGQVEILPFFSDKVYRGQVESFDMSAGTLATGWKTRENPRLVIVFEWIARRPIGELDNWERCLDHWRHRYAMSLGIYTAMNIGPGENLNACDRLYLTSRLTQEAVLLIPPNGSRLEKP